MELEYALLDNPLTNQATDMRAVVQNLQKCDEEDLIKRMLNMGAGLTESDIVSVLSAFKKVTADAVAEGRSVNTPLFQIHPSIQGVFRTRDDIVDGTDRNVHLNLQAGSLLREAVKQVKTRKLPMVFTGSYIVEVFDAASNTHNDRLTPGRDLKITGVKLKLFGADPAVGVYFVPNSAAAPVKVDPKDAVVNTPHELILPIPTLPAGQYRVRVITQYTGGSPIKTPHNYTFDTLLTVS